MPMQVERGDLVIIKRMDTGEITAVAKVYLVQSRRFQTRGYGSFLLSTGNAVNGGRTKAVKGTPQEIKEAEELLERRDEEAERAEEAKKQAEYDALSEEIKLARRLKFFVECHSEKTIAKMPIETLRAAVEWAKAGGFDVE